MSNNELLKKILSISPVVPVVTISDVEHAVPLAEALLAGGINIIEVTLRTDAALDVIERIARDVPDMVTGAGTITLPEHITQVKSAGAEFGVSPGTLEVLLEKTAADNFPLLPGTTTLSDMMRAQLHGWQYLKFFPAALSGGTAMLKNAAALLPNMKFCPTGGISLGNAPDYLALPNVACVGGSWLVPGSAVEAGDWSSITRLAKEASVLKR